MTTNQRGCLYGLILLVFGVFVCGLLPFVWLPGAGAAAAIPVIQVPGEVLVKNFLGLGPKFNLINTMVALIIVDVIVLAIAILVNRASKGWTKEVPGRFQGAIEALAGGLFGFVKQISGGRNSRAIFPLVATIFLVLLVGNWMSIIPGVESVGLFHCAHPNTSGYQGTRLSDTFFQIRNTQPLNGGTPVSLADEHACEEAVAHATVADYSSEDENVNPLLKYRFHITPFVRPAATDLNLTIGLALISFFFIQFYGFKEQGLNYMQKFIPIRSLGNVAKNPMGAIDLIVGPLELVSELSKIVSLSFRLFGNIFAGGILIAVMLFLVGTGIPIVFYALELIVGLAQALVFAVLTLVFISQAQEGHHGDEEHGEHAEHAEAH
ncbi:MAG: FoF1 ATP synthase subunit a [Anaerolineae bacterium]